QVESMPAGIRCPGVCDAVFSRGARVDLIATPAQGAELVGWSGACSGAGACSVTIGGRIDVTARFRRLPTVGAAVRGRGTGRITSSPAGIDCGNTCRGTFAFATPLTLTASAARGSVFTGWTGDCTGTAPCMLTLTGAITTTASFDLLRRLVVGKTGPGSG